tara:strand:- start:1752 stop:3110 length:1359 start_codon:yes stop_codon:yes gene_type:complete
MSRKIAIVGASMEGFLQLCDLINNKRYGDGLTKYRDDEYTLIHDPDKTHPYMINGAGVAFQDAMESEIYFTKTWLKKYCNGVDGCGYKYIGWGNRTDKNFMVSGCSLIFDIEKFRKEFIKDGGNIFGNFVKIKEEKIDSFEVNQYKCIINGVEYDYVIDCSEKTPLGWEDDYMNPSIDLTNSYVMIEKPVAGDWNYTIQYAAKHGHITGLPLTDKQIWIYLYDNNLNTVEEIREDFASVFPDENLDEYKSYEYTFKPKVSNYILHPNNKRYFRNGNALINIDPGSPGTSAQYTMFASAQICRYLFNEEARNDELIKHELQLNYSHYVIQTLQSFISFAYQYGSRHDTPFWNKVSKEARNYLDEPYFTMPTVFPGNPVSQELISDKFTEEDYRIAHHVDQAENQTLLPYDWMNNANMFYDYAIGLGAPYADKLTTLGNTNPPEDFGTIGYKCL